MNPAEGLLGSPAQWALPLGVSGAEPLRRAGQLLITGLCAILFAWWQGLLADWRGGQIDGAHLAMAVLAGLLWLAVALRVWRASNRPGQLTLVWGGLPPRRAPPSPSPTPPGWSVREWQAGAVSVHVVFDLGAWVLVKVVAQGGHEPASTAWSWLHAPACFTGESGHHLRALLFNRQANEVGVESAPPAFVAALVASWAGMQRRWSNLSSSSNPAGEHAGPAAIEAKARSRRATVSGGDFADTVVLDPSARPSQRGNALP